MYDVLPVLTWPRLKWNSFLYFPSEKSINPPPWSLRPLVIALVYPLISLDLSCAGAMSFLIIQKTRGTKVSMVCSIHSHNVMRTLYSLVILSPFNVNVNQIPSFGFKRTFMTGPLIGGLHSVLRAGSDWSRFWNCTTKVFSFNCKPFVIAGLKTSLHLA